MIKEIMKEVRCRALIEIEKGKNYNGSIRKVFGIDTQMMSIVLKDLIIGKLIITKKMGKKRILYLTELGKKVVVVLKELFKLEETKC